MTTAAHIEVIVPNAVCRRQCWCCR